MTSKKKSDERQCRFRTLSIWVWFPSWTRLSKWRRTNLGVHFVLLTVIKDKENSENRFRRINVRKIVSLEEITKLSYSNVLIEIDKSDSLKKLYESIKEKGNSKIQISIAEENKNYLFELKDKRKFDFETLKYLNREPYIKKINV